MPVTKTFKRTLDALDDLFKYLEEFIESQEVDPATAYAINLAVEELFTNMVKYSPGGADQISVCLELAGREVKVILEDHGVEPFDVTRPDEKAVEKRLSEKTPGGLGLFIIQQMVDDVTYQHKNGCSRITIIKRLES